MKIKRNDNEELERRKRNMKVFRTIMIILDVLALILLVIQTIIKDITYWSYIILVICNVLVFTIKIDSNKKSSNNR